jgi:eukaryotic-like serine/threonine-protein kinase
MPECLDAETLAAYLDGRLAEDAIDRADRHIDGCSTCRGELSALAASCSFPTGSGAFGLVDGVVLAGRLGRYEVLRELGRGSTSVVVRAYDPELARSIALKIVPDEFAEHVRREAQALARLAHPNVVAIYDVVPHVDATCIALELVDGVTLRDHVRGKPWRDVLATCIGAGRGLAAVHAAHLVHRDYKPENVLCAGDRVVVSDFGLARPDGAPETAILAGTPAYMAPELLRGEPASATSDQFSFCVATYEALYGERPFAGDTLAALTASTTAGVPRASPAGARVPRWLRALLVRGLAPDPRDRHASLADLLDALERGCVQRRARIVTLAAIAATLATGVILWWRK